MWNRKTPGQKENLSKGDDRIRELKQDLENAFITEFGLSFTEGIHDFLNIPELNLPNQVKLMQYETTGLYTLNIFRNNNWEKGTQLVDFSLNTIIPSCSNESFFGWQVVSLSTSYMLVLGNILLTADYGFGLDENINHHHGDANRRTSHTTLYHTHSFSIVCDYTDRNTITDMNILTGQSRVWRVAHFHHVTITDIEYISQGHSHEIETVNIGNFNTFFCKLIKRVV